MGNHSTIPLGVSPDICFNFERFYGRLMCFNAFGTRLQSFWIMFFLPEKKFLVE